MQLFSADAVVFSENVWIFLYPENIKSALKVTHDWPQRFFYVQTKLPEHSGILVWN